MAILVNGVKVAGAGVPGQNATINGVNALTIEAVAPLLAQMSGSTLTLSLDGGAGAQIESGSYMGTGTYGASNPNSYTFQFPPKLVFIYAFTGYTSQGWLLVDSSTGYYSNGSSSFSEVQVSASGNTVFWWSNGAGPVSNLQYNASGTTYYIVGIG